MPLLNGERYLADQLEALAGESVTGGFEVVVADNGSTDRSLAIVASYALRVDLRVVDASMHRAHAFARNIGARAARSSRLVFLDHDDVIAPGYLEVMRGALDRSQFVAARIETTVLNSGWLAGVRSVAQTEGLGEGPLPWAYGGTIGIRRSVFERAGGFDAGLFIAAEDIDLCWRVQEGGTHLEFVPAAVLRYRFPDTYRGLWRQGRRYGIGQVAVNKKHREALGIGRAPFASWARTFGGAARLAAFGKGRGSRRRGVFLLGRRVGLLQGSGRYRAWYW